MLSIQKHYPLLSNLFGRVPNILPPNLSTSVEPILPNATMGFSNSLSFVRSVTCLLLLVSIAPKIYGSAYHITHKNQENLEKSGVHCMEQIKSKVDAKYVNASNPGHLTPQFFEDISKPDSTIDDHCFSQCWFTQLGYISSEHELDKNAMATELQNSNATEALKTKANEIWLHCFTEISDVAKADGGFRSNPCKFSQKHLQCLEKKFKDESENIEKIINN